MVHVKWFYALGCISPNDAVAPAMDLSPRLHYVITVISLIESHCYLEIDRLDKKNSKSENIPELGLLVGP